jgi:hypothetical protein
VHTQHRWQEGGREREGRTGADFEEAALPEDVVVVEELDNERERLLRDLRAALDRVVAVHQHLRLDDRYQSVLLRESVSAARRLVQAEVQEVKEAHEAFRVDGVAQARTYAPAHGAQAQAWA